MIQGIKLNPSTVFNVETNTPVAANKPDDGRKKKMYIGIGIALLLLGGIAAGILVWKFIIDKKHDNGAPVISNDPKTEFAQWKAKYDKSYATPEEEQTAYNNFLINYNQAVQVNAEALTRDDVTLSFGPYADADQSSFASKILRTRLTDSDARDQIQVAQKIEALALAAPASIDWSTNPSMSSPVKNQGSCGGCWAFSTINALEVAYNLVYKPSQSIVLSSQQIIDCDSGRGNQGCNGGDPVQAFTGYLSPSSGNLVATEAIYPFKSGSSGQTGTCQKSLASKGIVGLVSYKYATTPCRGGTCAWSQAAEDALIQALMISPVSVCINAGPWQNYNGGILQNKAGGCTANYGDINHCVQLVGYDATSWKIKNQWTSSWGEKGYIRLARGANTCCILCEAVTTSVNAQGVTVPTDTATTTVAPVSGATTRPIGTTLKPLTTLKPAADPCSGVTCSYHGTCQALSSTQYQCKCNSGYDSSTDCSTTISTGGSGGKACCEGDNCDNYCGTDENGYTWCCPTSGTISLSMASDGSTTCTCPASSTPSTTKAPTPIVTSSPSPYTSVGCFADKSTAHALTNSWSANGVKTGFTLSSCAAAAKQNSDTYFALFNGGECYTGSSGYNYYGPSSACTSQCSDGYTCGGANAISVYLNPSATTGGNTGGGSSTPATSGPNAPYTPCSSNKSFCWHCDHANESARCYFMIGGSAAFTVFAGCPGTAPKCS